LEANKQQVQLIECPRDAMQGWKAFIPTSLKAQYLNQLLKVGFHTLDFGSFVSPKVIPQMADTKELLSLLQLEGISTRLLAIVANTRGAVEASVFNAIGYLGFPFSVSETFQQRNTNSGIDASFGTVQEIQEICLKKNKELVIYLSMGFGNPYGDPWSEEIVLAWAEKISKAGIRIISVADTVGLATPAQVFSVTSHLIKNLPGHTIGVHLHSAPFSWKEKIDAALNAGCMRFDGALKGIGGCPMANDELVGNIDSEKMIAYFDELGLVAGIDKNELNKSIEMAAEVFSTE
jgi:hydroxymethylglutaryl-CoA lyase